MPQLALLLTTLIWGATFPATKAVLDQVPPLSFLFVRFLIGAVLALAIVLTFKIPLRFDRSTLGMSAVATVWLFFGYVLQTDGLRYTTASNSAFITALYVVFVPLFLRRFEARIWVSAGLALLGLWFLIDPRVSLNIGDVMSLACAAAFAAHMVCLESYTRKGDAVSLFVWQMFLVTGVMFVAMLLESPEAAAFTPTPMFLMSLSVTGVCATGAFAIQMWAQKIVPAQRVALIFSLEPAYAAWLAWYFLGERLDPMGWFGSALILTAVLLGSMGKDTATMGASVRPSPAI
jgi:drug/metabolite transporter (DMT)-like permease